MRSWPLCTFLVPSLLLACVPDSVATQHDGSPDVASDVPPMNDAKLSADVPSSADAPDVAPLTDLPAAMDATTPPDASVAEDVTAAPDLPVTPDAPAPPRDFSVAGSHRVAIWTGAIAGTQGTARVFYPMAAGDARFPLVVFAHGFQLAVNHYDRLLTHVTSWGYVVASVDYPGSLLSVDHRNVPAALSAARRVFAMGGPTGFPAGARVDASRAVAMGHSLGGKGAIMALLSDTAFVAGLALDPVDDNPSPFGRVTDATPSIAPERMGGLRQPLGMFGATQSRCARLGQTCAPESSDYRQFAAAAPAGAALALWALRDFGHMDFVDPGCGFTCSACSGGGAPLDGRLAALRALSVAFLERFARGDASARGYINGAERDALVRAMTLWNGAMSSLPACR